ncbi:glycine-rich domain-containing protein [Mucilaginibacter achroorhodeus]|uniref:glycine-rich domain-containing protein n=1 Tax=Mucilaginibacter achroorhodeus TaxID=2599294 RepID=UPI0016450A50|nr:hypothetical protein [Mucilaginibacter achroorhodeus]
MNAQERALWDKLQAFEIDDPEVDFKFSARLARENGWNIPFSLRVIEEYKKFIFLCCVTKHGVTPSDPVDQAWHLHLTFTWSYWTDLCKNTLGQEVHHNPTKGGKQEANKFNGFYTSTHQLYKDKFGHEPPADIWQDNHTRFSDVNFQRVNLGKYWLVKKPAITVYSIVMLIVAAACFTFIQAVDSFIPFIVIGIFVLITIAVYKAEGSSDKWRNGNDRDDSGGSGCTAGGSSDWNSGEHHHGHSGCGNHHGGDSGCSSGCSGCSSSGCSGCGSGCSGGGD